MIQQDGRPDEDYRVVSIDPGTDTMGVALLGLNPVTLGQRFIDAFTWRGSFVDYNYRQMLPEGNDRDARLLGLQHRLYPYLASVQPHLVVFEDNYLKHSPKSYKALIEAVMCIKQAIWLYNPYIPFYSVKPMQAKAQVGGMPPRGQKATKDLVLEGLRHYTPLAVPHERLNLLDEHSVDAIAIGAYAIAEISNALMSGHWSPYGQVYDGRVHTTRL